MKMQRKQQRFEDTEKEEEAWIAKICTKMPVFPKLQKTHGISVFSTSGLSQFYLTLDFTLD